MERSRVALVRCDTYAPEAVYVSLRRGVELLGGLDRFVRSGERILLKPNVLAGEPPERAVTTHPSVLAAGIRLFREGGATVLFGDSPGPSGNAHSIERAGLLEAGLKAGAQQGDFSSGLPMPNPIGQMTDHFPIARAIHESDGLVSLSKMKTHELTRLTGAVKNLFGCVPGKRKALYHMQFMDAFDFSRMLVELNLTVRPRLHVMDGIIAMDGNGPHSGDPRPVGVLLLSDDPVAIDATFARLINMRPEDVPTTLIGQEVGLGRYGEEQIEIMGDELASALFPDFHVVRRPALRNGVLAQVPILRRVVMPRPVIDAELCTRCGACVEACPVPEKAVHFQDGRRDKPPVYEYDRCIRCYCCHEACPHRAIYKETPFLGKLLGLQ